MICLKSFKPWNWKLKLPDDKYNINNHQCSPLNRVLNRPMNKIPNKPLLSKPFNRLLKFMPRLLRRWIKHI